MGTFSVECRIENPTDRARAVTLPGMLVDNLTVDSARRRLLGAGPLPAALSLAAR